ncbi:MAG: hypothetical protein ACREM2_04015 [Vulcanimicrobiaceae bacterium]
MSSIRYVGSPFLSPFDIDTLHYRFVNYSQVPATRVVVEYDGTSATQKIVADGSFAPGVAIERESVTTLPLGEGSSSQCRLTSVSLANGMSWNASTEATAAAPAGGANRQ